MKFPHFAAPLFSLAVSTLSAFAVEPTSDSTARFIPIAENAWAGSSVNVVANIRQSLFTDHRTQFAAYYDADGFMVLAKRALGTDTWEIHRTAHRGNVADAHNSISLAVDGAGFLHVAWDHHGNPLHYARSATAGSLELASPTSMTSERETQVTYPQFFRLPDGDLLFLYRDGASGRGSLVLNRYVTGTGKWSAVQPNLIDGEGQRSPYWCMTVDRKGTLHLGWIWRDTPDVATNHDLAYARSTDGGVTWTRSDGTSLALPITAATAEYALRIPTNSNLMNSPVIDTNRAGHPYLCTYWSPTPGAPPQFQIVTHDGKAWQHYAGPPAGASFELAGPGTKHPPISRAALLVENISGATLIHLLYRDDSRSGRIIAATRDPRNAAAPWAERELTRDSVGAWEPAIDPIAWDRFQQAHLLVQKATQRDGDDHQAAPTAPGVIGDFIWSPITLRSREQNPTPAEPIPTAELEKPLVAAEILALSQKVADWQWAHMPDPTVRHPRGWETAPFYLGALALDRALPTHALRERMLQQAETLGWQPHARPYHADDYCVTQAYLELYHDSRDARMIEPTRKRLDAILAQPAHGVFDWGTPYSQEHWSWCDALFMAPVSWLLMWQETGDRRYLDFMNREWWNTTQQLFEPATHLYYRDESYLDVREANGRTIHWSRGTGWVFAGLVRVLDHFPKDHPDYPRYVTLYRELAGAILAAQQDDGTWRAALLDPAAHPGRETSGSAFYTFGLAWGVNHGLLDPKLTPAVRRAWNGLADCVTPEGKLEHVQPIGAAPQGFDPHNTEAFAVGGFLLAASEVQALAQKK